MPTLFDLLNEHKNSKEDKRVFGLVLQGGGMRGSYTAGAIMPLIAYGFYDSFDHIVGVSAGAITGAYFMSQSEAPMKAFTKDLASKDFVNLLRTDKIVDVDFAIDVVMNKTYPIDEKILNASKAKLHILVTDAKTGKMVVLSDHKHFKELDEELRASAALPLLYNKEIKIGDRYYIDGGVSDGLPIDVAVDLGCTDIVVILTQRIENISFDRRHVRLINHLVRRFAKDQPASVRRKLPSDEKTLKANLKLLKKPGNKIRIYALEPSDEEILITLGTIDRHKVKAFARLGISDADKFLNTELNTKRA